MPSQSNACTLDESARERRLQEIATLASSALLEAERTAQGARILLRDSPGTRAELQRLLAAEVDCCSFLRFGLNVTDGSLALDISGPESAQPLINGLFDLKIPAGEACDR
jgi:hypothetical protein